MAYSITFGEIGYNVLHDGKIMCVNVPTRAPQREKVGYASDPFSVTLAALCQSSL